MLVLSTVLGAVSGALGTYLSYWLEISSGASIVLLESGIFVIVVVAAGISGRRQVWTPAPASGPMAAHAFAE